MTEKTKYPIEFLNAIKELKDKGIIAGVKGKKDVVKLTSMGLTSSFFISRCLTSWSNFIAIKSKAIIVKMLNDEIKDSHDTTLSEKEFDDVNGWDIQGDDNKIFECGWISALKYIKYKVEEK